MPRIPFIEARFFEPTENRLTLEQRFRLHLQKLREAKGDEAYDLSEILGPEPESLCSSPLVGTEDVRKISRRTKRLLDRRDASSGLAHLKAEDRERLQALRNGVELIRIATAQMPGARLVMQAAVSAARRRGCSRCPGS
ncbi:hypothetical protein [uncultured Paracoccus sp.]|uniref:hypothetical protein n=1 Tax=uncultured Paracoccus sp. TaxID=189685 RepID=UPI002620EE94|nr:hypothetical protein [uncultured Paracoccus sp.]